MRQKKFLRNLILVLFSLLIVVVIINHFFFATTKPAEKKPLYWVDAMEPAVHYPGPGKSHMGMELTPVYADESQAEDKSVIKISSNVVNNLGVRVAPVTQGFLAKNIETVGYVEPNENKISHIHAYADGWIKNLIVKSVGEPVKQDQLLLQLYSPTLVNAQEEFITALASKESSLMDATYKKLQALHIAEKQIQQLKATRQASQLVNLYAPQNGVVAALSVREGMRITPETEIMSLVDLSTIWIIAQVLENQISWVKVGEPADAHLSAFPGEVWHGMVEYVYPQVDLDTHTIKVRFRFNNAKGLLKPNMYATVNLAGEVKSSGLTIPLEAVIRSSQGDRVIVALGEGRFQVREIVIGMESGNQVEIKSGLKLGESVVTSGQFLLDSEASLKAGSERLATAENKSTEGSTSIESEKIQGQGVITAINVAEHAITLEHQAIPSLNWPAMTMDFNVAKTVSFSGLKVNDAVQFMLAKEGDNWVISGIKKR